MPDQPEDPLHYEMKIPPEPKAKTEEDEAEAPESERESAESATAKDNNMARGNDKR